MNAHTTVMPRRTWPEWWRWLVVAVATLILCSCRAPSPQPNATAQGGLRATPAVGRTGRWQGGVESGQIPRSAVAMICDDTPLATVAACPPEPTPQPYRVCSGTFRPDGIKGPWPREDYVCDGGDKGLPVEVSPDWEIRGLDATDTVAHFDAVDGRTLVQPSNCVCLYAPRFAAVRTVARLVDAEQVEGPRGASLPVNIVRQDDLQTPVAGMQPVQPRGASAGRLPESLETRDIPAVLATQLAPRAVQDQLLPYANLRIMRTGVMDQQEKAWLAQVAQAAIVWTHNQGAQVTINKMAAVAAVGDQKSQVVYTVKDLRDSPRLRLCKAASTVSANPGDTVDFTLRFDNVGDQPLGNIVIVDNLTTRLEYVADSAQSSVEAGFSTAPNDDGSLVLRWEINKTLLPFEGGVITFKCRVR